MFSKLTSMNIIYWSFPLVLIFLHILLSKFYGWHLTFPQFLLVKYWKGKGKEVEAILSNGFFLSDHISKDFLTVHRLTLKSWWFIYPPIVVCLCGVGILIQISQGDWKPFAPQSVVPEPKALTTLFRNAELHPTPQVWVSTFNFLESSAVPLSSLSLRSMVVGHHRPAEVCVRSS